jgi:hypothetical protein
MEQQPPPPPPPLPLPLPLPPVVPRCGSASSEDSTRTRPTAATCPVVLAAARPHSIGHVRPYVHLCPFAPFDCNCAHHMREGSSLPPAGTHARAIIPIRMPAPKVLRQD